jgi:dTDP-6-deoxy-L-talose 4-dehydrogenase (NAD+)
MKILVTGSSGYIGRHVVVSCLNLGHEVYVSDFSYKGLDERAKRVEAPLFSGDKDIFDQLGRPDVLIHLAWRDGFVHNSNAHMKDLSDHVCFLNKMIDSGLKYLTVMGSMHEIGFWEGEVDAETPCNPMSMYGIAKNALRQELMLYTQNKPISFHWLRAFYIYGDDAHGSSIFSKLYQANEDGKTTFPFTSGKALYDFISIYELADMIAKASTQDTYNGIINVCTGKPISLADKVESYIIEKGMNIKLDYGAFPDRPYDSSGIWGNPSIIQKIMNS